MRVFSYIVRYDIGFAPNPFYGWCTLATCKQDIRAHAIVSDWVVGTGSKAKGRGGTLVFAMEVQELLTFEEYWADSRFTQKRANRRGSLKQRYGDNIYHRNVDGDWIQEDSRHSLADGKPNKDHVRKDTKANAVLASQNFVYHGGAGPAIPSRFREWAGNDICHDRPGYRCHFPPTMREAFIGWLFADADMGAGFRDDPLDWQRKL